MFFHQNFARKSIFLRSKFKKIRFRFYYGLERTSSSGQVPLLHWSWHIKCCVEEKFGEVTKFFALRESFEISEKICTAALQNRNLLKKLQYFDRKLEQELCQNLGVYRQPNTKSRFWSKNYFWNKIWTRALPKFENSIFPKLRLENCLQKAKFGAPKLWFRHWIQDFGFQNHLSKIQNRSFLFRSNLISRPKNLKSASLKTPKSTFRFEIQFFLLPKSWFWIRYYNPIQSVAEKYPKENIRVLREMRNSSKTWAGILDFVAKVSIFEKFYRRWMLRLRVIFWKFGFQDAFLRFQV